MMGEKGTKGDGCYQQRGQREEEEGNNAHGQDVQMAISEALFDHCMKMMSSFSPNCLCMQMSHSRMELHIQI